MGDGKKTMFVWSLVILGYILANVIFHGNPQKERWVLFLSIIGILILMCLLIVEYIVSYRKENNEGD